MLFFVPNLDYNPFKRPGKFLADAGRFEACLREKDPDMSEPCASAAAFASGKREPKKGRLPMYQVRYRLLLSDSADAWALERLQKLAYGLGSVWWGGWSVTTAPDLDRLSTMLYNGATNQRRFANTQRFRECVLALPSLVRARCAERGVPHHPIEYVQERAECIQALQHCPQPPLFQRIPKGFFDAWRA